MTDPGTLLETLRVNLAKDYEIEGFVARGSITLVFKAMERGPQRPVALKVVPPDAPPGFGERVRREARVAVNLAHANIVPIYAMGQAAGTDFYTMKYSDGCSLEWVMAQQGALSIPLVLTVLRAILSGLDYAHGRHVIHRDISDANVLIDRDGGVALADMGIARAIQKEPGAATVVIGAGRYMSPEQCAGQPIKYQADQYAVGVLAFQMLAGRLPFEADSTTALLELHVSAPPPEIETLRPDVPLELAAVVRRALSKTPAERYATTREMLLAVRAVPLSEDEQKAGVEQLQALATRAPEPTVLTGQAEPAPEPLPEPEPAPEPPPELTPEPLPDLPELPPEPEPEPLPEPVPPEPADPSTWSEPLRTPEWYESAPPDPGPPPAPTAPMQMPLRQGTLPKPWTLLPAPEPLPPPPPPEPVRPPRRSEPAFAEEPRQPRRSRSGAYTVPEESAAPARRSTASTRRSSASMPRPRRSIPVGPILGIVALIGIVALVAVVLTRKKAPPAPPAVVAFDSARAREVAESIATYAPTPTQGWVRVSGDLPEDAIVRLDRKRMSGRVFQAPPGIHVLEVATSEFQPFGTRIRVRIGDTAKVYVELELKPQTDSIRDE